MPVLLVSSEGLIVHANSRLETLFEYQPGELTGEVLEILIPKSLSKAHCELRDTFFESPTSRDMGIGRDVYGVTKSGEHLPVEIGLELIEQDGQQMVMASVLDIRERLYAASRLRRAIDAAASGMVEVDQDGVILLVNQEAREMFGYGPGELIGKPVELLVPETSRRNHPVDRQKYQARAEQRAMGRDVWALRKDGSEFPVEIGLTPITGPRGNSTLATIIDTTERKAVERQLRKNAQELEMANRELTDFAYSASHDLKAPLSSIAGLLTFCSRDLESGDLGEVHTNVERARALADRLSGRIENMLALAKSSTVPRVWQELDVEGSVREIWRLLSSGESSEVSFVTSFDHVGVLRTVPVLFQAILENLLSNAIKFKDKSRRSRVKVTTRSTSGEFYLSVGDNGIGIPSDCHHKVFQLFQRFSPDIEGSGLGLALVLKNVVTLGGEISFESTPEGSLFTVVLPQLGEVLQEEGGIG